jgi:hypothetical protein
MRRSLILLAVSAGAALVGAGVATGPAMASARDTRLTVTVRPAEGPARSAWLTCDPAGGTHPAARTSCTTLRAARGNPAAIPVGDGFCTMEYAPVTASVSGTWHRHPVRYRKTFGNTCVLRQATADLFHL